MTWHQWAASLAGMATTALILTILITAYRKDPK